jgi:hypothetical protein
MKYITDHFAFHAFWLSAIFLVFACGMIVGRYQFFPSQVLSAAEKGYGRLTASDKVDQPVFLRRNARDASRATVFCTSQACEGLTFVTRMAAGGVMSVNVMDLDGKCLHEWAVDWFKLWPDATHVPDQLVPKAKPGTMIHGAVLLEESGNLVFNFEYLGLLCLDFNGNVVWRLPYQTHHSITRADDGNLWVCGQKFRTTPLESLPNVNLPFREDMLLEVTPQGKIAHEWSIIDLLQKNDREGLIYLATVSPGSSELGGDIFHLNDVEPFPARLKEGFFKKGDILVSLRNINTVFVFNRENQKIKFTHTGSFVRQHDPDFVDGNTLSVFDNHPVAPGDGESHSRILLISATDQTVKTFYEGTPAHPFYTDIMGKHQWLPNGDLLLTEACYGRAIEISTKGEIVWEYNNYIEKGIVSAVEEATRLPPSYALLFTNSRLYAQALRSSKLHKQTSIAAKSNGGFQR